MAMRALIRSTELHVYGRFNLEPLLFRNSRKSANFFISENLNMKSTPARWCPDERDSIKPSSRPLCIALFRHWSERFSKRTQHESIFRHSTKPDHKCYSRMRLNILGFSITILFFSSSSSKRKKSLLKNDILTFRNKTTMAIICVAEGGERKYHRKKFSSFHSIDSKEKDWWGLSTKFNSC